MADHSFVPERPDRHEFWRGDNLPAPDAIEPITAFRLWTASDGELKSLNGDARWEPGQWTIARCSRTAHKAPSEGCSCGLYAAKELDELLFLTLLGRGLPGGRTARAHRRKGPARRQSDRARPRVPGRAGSDRGDHPPRRHEPPDHQGRGRAFQCPDWRGDTNFSHRRGIQRAPGSSQQLHGGADVAWAGCVRALCLDGDRELPGDPHCSAWSTRLGASYGKPTASNGRIGGSV
jgi:hypothetical protein